LSVASYILALVLNLSLIMCIVDLGRRNEVHEFKLRKKLWTLLSYKVSH